MIITTARIAFIWRRKIVTLHFQRCHSHDISEVRQGPQRMAPDMAFEDALSKLPCPNYNRLMISRRTSSVFADPPRSGDSRRPSSKLASTAA
jgi:hypothetical protein